MLGMLAQLNQPVVAPTLTLREQAVDEPPIRVADSGRFVNLFRFALIQVNYLIGVSRTAGIEPVTGTLSMGLVFFQFFYSYREKMLVFEQQVGFPPFVVLRL